MICGDTEGKEGDKKRENGVCGCRMYVYCDVAVSVQLSKLNTSAIG